MTLRYFNVFGPRQDPGSPYAAVIPRFILAALRGEPPVIYGDGGQTRDFVYVANVVHANLLACHALGRDVVGQVLNVGCGEALAIRRLWELIQELTGTRLPAQYAPGRLGEVRDSRASIERIRSAIGYTPEVELEAGLRLTIDYYREAEARRYYEVPVGEDSLSPPPRARASRATLRG